MNRASAFRRCACPLVVPKRKFRSRNSEPKSRSAFLNHVVSAPVERPRKTLGYQTPAEMPSNRDADSGGRSHLQSDARPILSLERSSLFISGLHGLIRDRIGREGAGHDHAYP